MYEYYLQLRSTLPVTCFMKRLKNRKVTRKIGLVRPFLTSDFRGIFQRSNDGHKDFDFGF